MSSSENKSRTPVHPDGYFDVLCRRILRVCMAALFLAVGVVILWELRTSTIQAHVFASQAKKLTFATGPGPSQAISFPKAGPFDLRHGYSRLPGFLKRLDRSGFEIASQARFSPLLFRAAKMGLSPPYREKTQTGLTIVDRNGRPVYRSHHPQNVYRHYSAVPPPVATALLYIENRELLDIRHPKQNPTVEWDRLALAAYQLLTGGGKGPGASTLATQIEKMRHSPQGITPSPGEKLRQMLSASLRAYRDGEKTLRTRQHILVEYLNALPLAAAPNWGEIIGLADGLRIWYGADFAAVNGYLQRSAYFTPKPEQGDRALAFKQVLSLLIAQRRPTYFLTRDREGLKSLTDSYLRILAKDGIITPELRDEALAQKLVFRDQAPTTNRPPLWQRQAADVVRADLVSQLGVPDYYQLDRLDLNVHSTLDLPVQRSVTEILRGLADPKVADALGLVGYRRLGAGDFSKVKYSVTLYERGEKATWLRLQASNLDTPFNVSEGARLDLGSTAKLRTVVSYLEIMAGLYRQYAPLRGDLRRHAAKAPRDPLTRWAIKQLSGRTRPTLKNFLSSALSRKYSARPDQSFFTGGGLHRFSNFNPSDNRRVVAVTEALHKSVNLVFVRMMRDIVYYHRARLPGFSPSLLKHRNHARRRAYLERFADHEGRQLLRGFYRDYSGKMDRKSFKRLIRRAKAKPASVAAVLRYVYPKVDELMFGQAIRLLATQKDMSTRKIARLYADMAANRLDLEQRSHIAGLHPLELWLVKYLRQAPKASFADITAKSKAARIAAYGWLYRTRNKQAQDLRIRTVLEIAAFREIGKSWRRLGYPFGLVPSYATALGSSADRPAALGELLGIIMNRGVRRGMHRFERLHFAAGTPYETVVVPEQRASLQVLPAEVADAVRQLMIGTVSKGTARRAFGAIRTLDGKPLPIGGKTGTGDNRHKIYAGSVVVGERALSRSAVFMFTIGDRFFGVITAYVEGPKASEYKFTSSLAVQLFSALGPLLQPMVDGQRGTMAAARGQRKAGPPISPYPAPKAKQLPARDRKPAGSSPIRKDTEANAAPWEAGYRG